MQGIAYDVTAYSETTVVDDKVPPVDTFRTTVTMDVRLKLQTVVSQPLRGARRARVAPGRHRPGDLVYIVTPLARYTADEECNVGASGDTLQTITIRTLVRSCGQLSRRSPGDRLRQMQVAGESGPPIEFDIRHDLATPGADSTLYDIKVEDATTGLPIDGRAGHRAAERHAEHPRRGHDLRRREVLVLRRLRDRAGHARRCVHREGLVRGAHHACSEAIDFPSLSKRREAIVVRV